MYTYYTNVVPLSPLHWRLFGYFHVEIQMKTHLNASPARVLYTSTFCPRWTSLAMRNSYFIRSGTGRKRNTKWHELLCDAMCSLSFEKYFRWASDRENIFQLCRHVCSIAGKWQRGAIVHCKIIAQTNPKKLLSFQAMRQPPLFSAHGSSHVQMNPHTNQKAMKWLLLYAYHFRIHSDLKIRVFCRNVQSTCFLMQFSSAKITFYSFDEAIKVHLATKLWKSTNNLAAIFCSFHCISWPLELKIFTSQADIQISHSKLMYATCIVYIGICLCINSK